MFIAHFPTGYIGARAIEKLCPTVAVTLRLSISRLFIIGNVIPDVDMLYFYLIDHRAHHHHLYWTHLPVFWITLYLMTLAFALVIRSKTMVALGSALFSGIILHLLLDTPMGGVAWLYPYSTTLIYLTTVPARYSWWVLNFIFHWTFLTEVLICIVAGTLLYSKHRFKT